MLPGRQANRHRNIGILGIRDAPGRQQETKAHCQTKKHIDECLEDSKQTTKIQIQINKQTR